MADYFEIKIPPMSENIFTEEMNKELSKEIYKFLIKELSNSDKGNVMTFLHAYFCGVIIFVQKSFFNNSYTPHIDIPPLPLFISPPEWAEVELTKKVRIIELLLRFYKLSEYELFMGLKNGSACGEWVPHFYRDNKQCNYYVISNHSSTFNRDNSDLFSYWYSMFVAASSYLKDNDIFGHSIKSDYHPIISDLLKTYRNFEKNESMTRYHAFTFPEQVIMLLEKVLKLNDGDYGLMSIEVPAGVTLQ